MRKKIDTDSLDTKDTVHLKNTTLSDRWIFYKAGWRPALGWLSVLVVFWVGIVHPTLSWGLALLGINIVLPVMDSGIMLNLVAIVIGVGAMRSYEKTKRRNFEEEDYD